MASTNQLFDDFNFFYCFCFQLLCRLINYAHISNCPVTDAEQLLEEEIVWLRSLPAGRGTDQFLDEAVLEGRLGLVRELLGFSTPEHKFDLGSNEAKGGCLIKVGTTSRLPLAELK